MTSNPAKQLGIDDRGRLARGRQGRRLRGLERRSAVDVHRGARDLDRGQEVLRPRGGPGGAARRCEAERDGARRRRPGRGLGDRQDGQERRGSRRARDEGAGVRRRWPRCSPRCRPRRRRRIRPPRRRGVFSIVGATIHPSPVRTSPGARSSCATARSSRCRPARRPRPRARRGAAGKHLYPSLFPPMTILGLAEISAVRATVDRGEIGRHQSGRARVDSPSTSIRSCCPVARSGGVLVAGVTPIGGIISGTAAAMKLDGWTREDATLRDPAAITVFWPRSEDQPVAHASRSVKGQEKRRDDALESSRRRSADARAYGKARAAEGQPGVPRHDGGPEARGPRAGVEGKIPVVMQARTDRPDPRRAEVGEGGEAARGHLGRRRRVARSRASWPRRTCRSSSTSPLDLPLRADDPYDAKFANAGGLASRGRAGHFQRRRRTTRRTSATSARRARPQ